MQRGGTDGGGQARSAAHQFDLALLAVADGLGYDPQPDVAIAVKLRIRHGHGAAVMPGHEPHEPGVEPGLAGLALLAKGQRGGRCFGARPLPPTPPPSSSPANAMAATMPVIATHGRFVAFT